jgi:hypothetical protein
MGCIRARVRVAKLITLRGVSNLEDSKNLQLELDVARRLRLAAIAHVYSNLPYLSVIAAYSLVRPV